MSPFHATARIFEILLAGWSGARKAKTIGDWDQVMAQAIWEAVNPTVDDDAAADLEKEIKAAVLRLIVNFAEGFNGLTADEIRRRGGK